MPFKKIISVDCYYFMVIAYIFFRCQFETIFILKKFQTLEKYMAKKSAGTYDPAKKKRS